MESFFNILATVSDALKAGGIFLLFGSLLGADSAMLIIALVIKKGGAKIKAIFYFVAGFAFFGALALLLANVQITVVETVITISALLAVFALLNIPIKIVELVKPKKVKTKSEQTQTGREFVRNLQREHGLDKVQNFNEAIENEQLSESRVLPIMNLTKKQAEEEKRQENIGETLSFSHVKNVIDRVSQIELSAQDKRTIRELEIAVMEAEKGRADTDIKNRLNDGLNSLLKIMARYGV